MYKLVISPQAQKELKKIKAFSKSAIGLVLEEIREDPTLGKPLTRDLNKKFSYRVGVYRVIYKINSKDKIVNILSTGHRAIVYN